MATTAESVKLLLHQVGHFRVLAVAIQAQALPGIVLEVAFPHRRSGPQPAIPRCRKILHYLVFLEAIPLKLLIFIVWYDFCKFISHHLDSHLLPLAERDEIQWEIGKTLPIQLPPPGGNVR